MLARRMRIFLRLRLSLTASAQVLFGSPPPSAAASDRAPPGGAKMEQPVGEPLSGARPPSEPTAKAASPGGSEGGTGFGAMATPRTPVDVSFRCRNFSPRPLPSGVRALPPPHPSSTPCFAGGVQVRTVAPEVPVILRLPQAQLWTMQRAEAVEGAEAFTAGGALARAAAQGQLRARRAQRRALVAVGIRRMASPNCHSGRNPEAFPLVDVAPQRFAIGRSAGGGGACPTVSARRVCVCVAKIADLEKTIDSLGKEINATTAAAADMQEQMKRASENREGESADF